MGFFKKAEIASNFTFAFHKMLFRIINLFISFFTQTAIRAKGVHAVRISQGTRTVHIAFVSVCGKNKQAQSQEKNLDLICSQN